jgi:hypothetical protein
MSSAPSKNKFLFTLGIVLMSIAAFFTLAGGIGTTCIAFNAAKFGAKWEAFVPVQPILQVLVVISILAGIAMVYATVRLGRARMGAYRLALITLAVGALASGIQYYLSATLRNGSTAPNSMRLYMTILTLLVMLLFRLPGIWQKIGYEKGSTGAEPPAGAISLFLCGLLTMSTPLWAAPSHLVDGYNTANELLLPLLLSGAVMLLISGALWVWRGAQVKQLETTVSPE